MNYLRAVPCILGKLCASGTIQKKCSLISNVSLPVEKSSRKIYYRASNSVATIAISNEQQRRPTRRLFWTCEWQIWEQATGILIIMADWLQFLSECISFPAGIFLLQVNNGNTRTMSEIYSKLAINTAKGRLMSIYYLYC